MFRMYWKSDNSPPAPMIVLLLICLSLSNDLYRFVEPYDPAGPHFVISAQYVGRLEHSMPDFPKPYRLDICVGKLEAEKGRAWFQSHAVVAAYLTCHWL